MQQDRVGASGRAGQLLTGNEERKRIDGKTVRSHTDRHQRHGVVIGCLLFLLIIGCGFPVAQASTPPAHEKASPQRLSFALGYVSISGNSKSTSGNLKAAWRFTTGKLRFDTNASFFFTDITDGNTGDEYRKTERYQLAVKGDFRIWDKGGIFATLGWLKNEPAGIEENYSLATGFSRTLTEGGPLRVEGGLGVEGFRETRLQTEGPEEVSRMAAYMEVDVAWRLNDHNEVKFGNESRMSLSNGEDFRLASVLSYHSSINSKLAVEVAYEHQYKNLPVEGKGTTDAVTTVNLVFKF